MDIQYRRIQRLNKWKKKKKKKNICEFISKIKKIKELNLSERKERWVEGRMYGWIDEVRKKSINERFYVELKEWLDGLKKNNENNNNGECSRRVVGRIDEK